MEVILTSSHEGAVSPQLRILRNRRSPPKTSMERGGKPPLPVKGPFSCARLREIGECEPGLQLEVFGHGFPARIHLELSVDVPEVRPNGIERDAQFFADSLVGQSSFGELQHFQFAFG